MSRASRFEAPNLVAEARERLGYEYGLGQPLRKAELARLLGLGEDFMGRLARGTVALSGPVEVVLRMLLAGHRSPWHEDALRSRYRRARAGS